MASKTTQRRALVQPFLLAYGEMPLLLGILVRSAAGGRAVPASLRLRLPVFLPSPPLPPLLPLPSPLPVQLPRLPSMPFVPLTLLVRWGAVQGLHRDRGNHGWRP